MRRAIDERFQTDLLPAIREDVMTNIGQKLAKSDREGLRSELRRISEDKYREMKHAQDDLPPIGISQPPPPDDVSDRSTLTAIETPTMVTLQVMNLRRMIRLTHRNLPVAADAKRETCSSKPLKQKRMFKHFLQRERYGIRKTLKT